MIAVRHPLLFLALALGCAHLVPPAAPAENGLPAVDPTHQPLPEPVRLASARNHGSCDTGAQCVEHIDPSYPAAQGKATCEGAEGTWLTGPCPHRRALSACISRDFLVFDYVEARAREYGNPLHRTLAEAREACLSANQEFYELTP